MKPTQRQIQLAKDISNHILGIVNTNDIGSPSHWNLNEESANIIADDYFELYYTNDKHEELAKILKDCFDNAIIAIRKVEPKEIRG